MPTYMAAKEADVSDAASIALLRRLRGGEELHFVHRVDVCSAAPECLVADLEPVPGTGLADDGYSSVWYFFCAKRFKNSQGKAGGYKERAVSGGGGTSWHAERRPRGVEGSGGGTVCNFSYGRKKEGSGKKFDRMGWIMREYDDRQQDDAAASSSGGNYVLRKVYRSSRAKGNSSSSSNTTAKRKAGGDHPEAPPTKLIQQQQETAYYDYPAMPCYGQLPLDNNMNPAVFGEEQQELAVQRPGGDIDDDIDGFNFNTDFLQVLRAETGQSRQEREQGQGSEYIQIPWGGPVVPEVDQAPLRGHARRGDDDVRRLQRHEHDSTKEQLRADELPMSPLPLRTTPTLQDVSISQMC